ncbi:unnamed protein product [Sympodiomycopsis kandeliae]
MSTTLRLYTSKSSQPHQQDEGQGQGQDQDEYRLLELPDEIAKLIEGAQQRRNSAKRKRTEEGDGSTQDGGQGSESDCLVINGNENDEAVLSTDDATYALRQVNQSNSLLLCSLDQDSRLDMKVNISSTLELTRIVPRLDRLGTLLRESSYTGQEDESRKQDVKRYTAEEVSSIIQASRVELLQGFKERCVLELDGYMRMISSESIETLLRSLLLILDSNSYLYTQVPIKEVVQELKQDSNNDVREEILHALLTNWFGQQHKEEDVVQLDMQSIARFLGEQLLKKNALQPMALDKFMKMWSQALPQFQHDQGDDSDDDEEDLPELRFPNSNSSTKVNKQDTSPSTLRLNLELLSGQYITLPLPPLPSSQLQYYPKSMLSTEPASRFQELFLIKSSWYLTELEPFIEDLSVDSKRREALLLRYARAKKVIVPADKKKGEKQREVTLYSARVKY